MENNQKKNNQAPEQDFNEIVRQNIYKFLDLIIEKDAQKEELKKGLK